jgi:hypothetical protein
MEKISLFCTTYGNATINSMNHHFDTLPNKQIGHKGKQRSAKQYTETQLKPLANSDVLEG